jgi:hypothetical protein
VTRSGASTAGAKLDGRESIADSLGQKQDPASGDLPLAGADLELSIPTPPPGKEVTIHF